MIGAGRLAVDALSPLALEFAREQAQWEHLRGRTPAAIGRALGCGTASWREAIWALARAWEYSCGPHTWADPHRAQALLPERRAAVTVGDGPHTWTANPDHALVLLPETPGCGRSESVI